MRWNESRRLRERDNRRMECFIVQNVCVMCILYTYIIWPCVQMAYTQVEWKFCSQCVLTFNLNKHFAQMYALIDWNKLKRKISIDVKPHATIMYNVDDFMFVCLECELVQPNSFFFLPLSSLFVYISIELMNLLTSQICERPQDERVSNR